MSDEYFNPLVSAKEQPEKLKQSALAKYKQTARRNAVDDVSVCVECGKQMRLLETNGIPCHVCLEHRVCFPCKDS